MRLYTASTPNGRKVQIALAELGLPYEAIPVDLHGGAQRESWFTELCPNGKIPVLQDGDRTIWESGAILLYLGEEHDPEARILPKASARRWEAIQLAFFQAAGLGPNLGRLSEQLQRPPDRRNPETVAACTHEVDRILGVLDRILEDGRPFLTTEFSIADIMHYPWLQPVLALGASQLTQRPRVVDWLHRLEARPAVQEVFHG